MTDGDTIAQLAVVILLLGMAVPGLSTAHDFSGTPIEYEEELTVDYSVDSEVSEAATEQEGYGSEPVITGDGSTLERDVDYRWNSTDGTVDWLNSTNTTDGQTATIQYAANQRTAETAAAWTIIAPLMGLFGLFGLVASVRTLWSYVAEIWEATA